MCKNSGKIKHNLIFGLNYAIINQLLYKEGVFLESINCVLSTKGGSMFLGAKALHDGAGSYLVKMSGTYDRQKMADIIGLTVDKNFVVTLAKGVVVSEETLMKIFSLDPKMLRHFNNK